MSDYFSLIFGLNVPKLPPNSQIKIFLKKVESIRSRTHKKPFGVISKFKEILWKWEFFHWKSLTSLSPLPLPHNGCMQFDCHLYMYLTFLAKYFFIPWYIRAPQGLDPERRLKIVFCRVKKNTWHVTLMFSSPKWCDDFGKIVSDVWRGTP